MKGIFKFIVICLLAISVPVYAIAVGNVNDRNDRNIKVKAYVDMLAGTLSTIIDVCNMLSDNQPYGGTISNSIVDDMMPGGMNLLPDINISIDNIQDDSYTIFLSPISPDVCLMFVAMLNEYSGLAGLKIANNCSQTQSTVLAIKYKRK